MDTSNNSDEIIRKCYNCNEHVICNLNIINNVSNTTFTLWNKFQMFIYEGVEFETTSKVIVPEFQIHNLITTNNYLMCLDYAGNVHTTPLKFKNAPQKRFKYGFQPRDTGIVFCSLFSEDRIMCLKCDSDVYFLSVHKINTDFSLVKRTMLKCNQSYPLQEKREKYFLKTYAIGESHLAAVKNMFNIEDVNLRNNYSIVVITFDKLSVYSCLFSAKMSETEISLVKLYTCPAEIASIDFIELEDIYIVIGLTMGTLICINLSHLNTPKIVHLNTAIYKLLAFKDMILYTNGITMWKAEKVLSEDIKFSQFFVKDVKDFLKFGDQIICTTFKDLIYTFSIDDERSYLKPQSVEEYCSIDNVINDSEYLDLVTTEVNKADQLIKVQKKEKSYISALTLVNRPDVVNKVINYKVVVYESYEDAISENTNVLLTNNFSEYFHIDSFYLLINLKATDNEYDEVFANTIGDLRLHITIKSKSKVIKTTTVKITEVLKQLTLLVPLKTKFINVAEMGVFIKIMTDIPGARDPKQRMWIVLNKKTTILNSESFIRFNLKPNNILCLKESNESLKKQILQATLYQYGSLFYFTDNTEERPVPSKWQMYVRLPAQYEEVFKNEIIKNQFPSKKVRYFLQQFTSEDFLKSRSSLSMSIIKEKVDIVIDNDGFSNPTLRISSHNAKITLDVRNFLSNLVYCLFANCEPGKEFISHSFYITVENLQRAITECITSSSIEDLLPLIEQFEKKIIGSLPI